MIEVTQKHVVIANFGVGNVGSVANMIKKVGGTAIISSNAEEISDAQKLILPGVGAFDHGMRKLREAGLHEALEEAVLRRHVPILGICLGMQLMLNSSEEGGMRGLGWISGEVKRFPITNESPRVPHMGWNEIRTVRKNPLLPVDEATQRFYFVHSYKVECAASEDVIGVSEYGQNFCSAFGRDNIFGVQFHPEKSHVYGMTMFKRFLEL